MKIDRVAITRLIDLSDELGITPEINTRNYAFNIYIGSYEYITVKMIDHKFHIDYTFFSGEWKTESMDCDYLKDAAEYIRIKTRIL